MLLHQAIKSNGKDMNAIVLLFPIEMWITSHPKAFGNDLL